MAAARSTPAPASRARMGRRLPITHPTPAASPSATRAISAEKGTNYVTSHAGQPQSGRLPSSEEALPNPVQGPPPTVAPGTECSADPEEERHVWVVGPKSKAEAVLTHQQEPGAPDLQLGLLLVLVPQ